MTRPGRFALFVALALPGVSLAHGGVPAAYNLFEVDGPNGPELRVESNFGIFRPAEGGGWRLICEEAVSPGVKWFHIASDDRIFMGSGAGLSTSTDECTFTPATGSSIAVRRVEAITMPGEAPPALVALLDVYVPGRNLQVTFDRGVSVVALASPEGVLVNAIRGDPSAPGVLHTTAQVAQGEYAHLSYDFMTQAWSEPFKLEVPGIPRVAGATAGAVFFRNSSPAGQSLWRLDKQTRALTEVLPFDSDEEPSTAFFTLLEDGIWIGNAFKQPRFSADDGLTWVPADAPESTMCVRRIGGVLHACLFDLETFVGVVKKSADGWAPVLRYKDVVGMVSCAPNTHVGRTCDDLWPTVQANLNPGGVPSPEPVPEEETPVCGGCTSTGPAVLMLFAVVFARRRLRR